MDKYRKLRANAYAIRKDDFEEIKGQQKNAEYFENGADLFVYDLASKTTVGYYYAVENTWIER